jgi:hypothetical protein
MALVRSGFHTVCLTFALSRVNSPSRQSLKLAVPLEPENKVFRVLASPDPDITHALDRVQYLVTV